MRRLLTPPVQAWVENLEERYMKERLRALEQALASFLCRSHQHDCILEETGVCPYCESYWDIRDEIEYEIMMEKEELAPLWAMQSKQRMACLRRGIGGISLDDNIVGLALIINGQRETSADLRRCGAARSAGFQICSEASRPADQRDRSKGVCGNAGHRTNPPG